MPLVGAGTLAEDIQEGTIQARGKETGLDFTAMLNRQACLDRDTQQSRLVSQRR